METRKGVEILGFHPYFDIRHKQDDRAVSSIRRPDFNRKEFPC
jgi:hypothetical protein